jgi:DNA-binding SARP family transcriptional activator
MGTQARGGSLGTVIRERRQRAGWTQRQLAEAAAVSVGIVRDLEQGQRPWPRRAALERLAAALHISVAEVRASAGPDGAATRNGAGPGLRLSVLGPLKAWRDGVAVPVGGDRRKAVLGLLALHGGAVVSHDTFTQALWEGEPPPTATAMVQTYISRIRAALETGPSRDPRQELLPRTGDGYRLRTDGVGLDLRESEGLIGQARAALTAGRAEAACGLFEQALDLWHEEPLADVGLLRRHPAVVRLQALHAGAVVEHAETAVARGWYGRAVPRLYALIERAPLDEGAHACLMIALAGTGQQGAALELYQQIRVRLDDELGVRPGRSLTDAHLRVLRREVPAARTAASLGDGTAPRAGHGVTTAAATPGPAADDTAPAAPEIVMPDGGPFQLPPAVADFTGREPQIARLRAWLLPAGGQPGVPVVVISGPPGAGKSALMLHTSQVLRRSFPDGQLWARLDGASECPRDPGEVLGEWLRALGVHGSAVPDRVEERASLYRSRLADRRMLIAADDAESAAQVLPLLPGTAGCAVVVTSRRQLADLAGARLLALGPLSKAEATDLLGRIAGPHRVTAEAQAAGDLVAACGRLPLAVRVAGAKLATLQSAPIAALAKTLATERRRLDVLRVGDLSVRASIASGYLSLSEPARQAFRLLGLLGPCDVAEWVIAALLDQRDATAVVEELTDFSMVSVVSAIGTGQARYRLHDLLRDYAAVEALSLPDADRNAALARAHNGWLQLAAGASGRLPPDPFFPIRTQAPVPGTLPGQLAGDLTADPLAWFHAERRNLLAVVERACTWGDYRFAALLASYQGIYQHLQERHQDAEQIWRAVAAAAERARDPLAVAEAGLRVAVADVERGYSSNAAELLDDCVATFDKSGDSSNLADALYWRGVCAWDLDSFALARDDTERGVQVARRIGDLHAEFMNLRVLGLALSRLGDYAGGIAACEQALDLANQLGGSSFLQYALHNLCHTCDIAGEYDRAIELAVRRRELCRAEGDLRGAALSEALRGDAYLSLGRYREAVDAYTQALPVFRYHSIRRHEGVCRYKLGCAYWKAGEAGPAALHLTESLSIFRDLRLPSYEERARQLLTELRQA